MKGLSKDSARWHEVGEEGSDQRVDNYLTRLLKGVPKSHIYRILRSGEVRVNSGRVGPEHRLRPGDRLRPPPVRAARFLELVHRLDRETSGVLLIAKKRSALTHLHAQLREGGAQKFYLALVRG